MTSPRSLSPAQASAALGVSAKALRLYEQHGLLVADRTRTGWRSYDEGAIARAAEIVALRSLGVGLAQVARILDGQPRDLEAGLAAHAARLQEQVHRTEAAIKRLRPPRPGLAQCRAPVSGSWPQNTGTARRPVGFALPWPWGGEWFAIDDLPRLAFITGPLGSGKTRFAQRLAAALPDAAFVGLDRRIDPARRPADHAALAERIECRLDRLVRDGAERSEALTALLVVLEAAEPATLVIDMVEEGLDAATQTALMADLRRRATDKSRLILMTRSAVIIDLEELLSTERVFFCPANHGVPLCVVPRPGQPGYEAIATCVASPEVRARTAGMVAVHPGAGGSGAV